MPIVIVGILQLFVTNEVFILIEIFYLSYLFVLNRGKIKLGINMPLIIMVLILLIGSLSGIENLGTRNYIRDLFYFINPLTAIFLGIYSSKDEKSYGKLLNSLVCVSIITVFYDLAIMSTVLIKGFQIDGLRTYFDRTMWGNVFSIGILLLSKNKFKYKRLIVFILIVSIVLGLSRTLWIETIIMILIITLFSKKYISSIIKSLKYIITSLLVFYLVSYSLNVDYSIVLNKISNSFNEVSYDNDIWSSSDIQANWRGYEIKQAREQFIENDFVEKMFGEGFGNGIYVGKYASLVHQSGNYIYVIHNGFYDILIKAGIIGFILYVILFVSLCFYSIKIYKVTKSKLDILVLGTSLCLIVYTYLVKGIFSDYQQFNALLLIGGWLRYRRNSEIKTIKENINETEINRD